MADEVRRSFLEKLVWMGTAAFGAVTSIPLVGSLLHPVLGRRSAGGPSFLRVARLEGLAAGVPRKFTLVGDTRDGWIRATRRRLGAVWLLRGEGDRVTAYSVVCPHLGCGIDYREAESCFSCPCHGSTFALDGKRLEGPSPRGLDALETKIVAGDVLVRFVKYRQGIADKIPSSST